MPTIFRRFLRLRLRNKAFKTNLRDENTSEGESLESVPAHEAKALKGLLNLSFLEDNIKRTGFQNLLKTEDSLPKTEDTKRIQSWSIPQKKYS